MKSRFSQGSIIEDIRTERYKGIRCKGIVITARCDVAQGKVENYHYLTALDISDWIYEVLYFEIIQELINAVFNQIKDYIKDRELDYKTIISLEPDKAKIVLEANIKKGNEINKINEWVEKWKKYNLFQEKTTTRENRKAILVEYGEKRLVKRMLRLYNSGEVKYCFIPEKAYTTNKSSVNGLVVDLQDIHQVRKETICEILEYRYDCKLVNTTEQRNEINEKFFFENDDDFVIIESIIESPWIEYLLQHFANSYIRIGIDNANEDEICSYCRNFLEEIE